MVSTPQLFQFLQQELGDPVQTPPLLLIGFSAGVVTAMGAAMGWSAFGGQIQAVIALDGWGVPQFGNFPLHRLSHEEFAHWSSGLLGMGDDSFYADPAVEHLDLWRSPQTTRGWWLNNSNRSRKRQVTTAAEFLTMLVRRYTST